jgi:uncharacterized protein (TIRG00374 family)
VLRLFAKLAVGALAVALVASKVDLLDALVLADGGILRGRIADSPPGEWSLVATWPGGSESRHPLASGAVLLARGTELAIEEQGRVQEIRDFRYEGALRITTEDGSGREVRLSLLALAEQLRPDGWTERRPDIREGILSVFGRVSAGRYAAALALLVLSYLVGMRRWQGLLRAQGLPMSFFETMRLTFIGLFFNNVVPGLTGGDVVKAVLAARDHPGRRAIVVGTVIVDRVLGLLVLALISAVVLLLRLREYGDVARWVFLLLAAGGAGILLFFSRRVRRAIRLDALLNRLPGAGALRALDQAFLAYRRQGRAVLAAAGLSVLAHAANILSIYIMGRDLGVGPEAGLRGDPLITYLATVPIILIVSSVPLLPGGWGVGEAAYGFFFRAVGVGNLSLSVGLSVLTRASMLLVSLAGGPFFLLERRRLPAATVLGTVAAPELPPCPSPSSDP